MKNVRLPQKNIAEKFLPDWGPYSKKYMGISKIVQAAREKGVRFDCVIHPTLANSAVPVPNVTVPSSYHIWEAAEDLSYYCYRYELEWKDKVYADVSFSRIKEDTYLIRTEYVNNSSLPQNCILNYYNAIEYPYKMYWKLQLPLKNIYWKATDYEDYEYAVPRPWDCLNPDGAYKGEFFDETFTEHRGLGDRVSHAQAAHLDIKAFGAVKEDMVSYRIPVTQEFTNGVLMVRYRTTKVSNSALFRMNFIQNQEVQLPASDELTIYPIPIGELSEGTYTITFYSLGDSGIELDFFAVVENSDKDELQCEQKPQLLEPKVTSLNTKISYQYKEIEDEFYFQTLNENVRYRSIPTGCLEDAVITRLSNSDETFDHVTNPFTNSFKEKKSDMGYYHNTVVHSIFVPVKEHHVEYAIISNQNLRAYTAEECENIWIVAKGKVNPLGYTKGGQDYQFSNQILKATALTNIVYPIYRHGKYIKHHTPGKRWDCLYTWDSGFIGLGLLEFEPALAEYILDTYLSEKENKDFAFLHHGSIVPVQMFLYLELLKKSNDKSKLYGYYDQLKRYYDYLAGKTEGSTTARFASDLLTTYDYFYNCSGMDDLPPQAFMHKSKLQGVTAPAITTSQVIRCAKILNMVAIKVNKLEDCFQYTSDIERLTNGLQTYSWDEESGYFSYVIHDEDNQPIELLKSEQGENLNKGMDGIYPIIAGICTPEQKDIILSHLQSEKEMFSKVGISAVDMSAKYYSKNGYWNGNVWFSHQWFIWKTMLDIGEKEFAYQIAITALNSWKKEVDHSYYTFEMLNIETERGGWFHQFGGLSTPINIWANAYYKVGTVNSGFDMWIEKQSFDSTYDNSTIEFYNYSTNEESVLIVVMNEEHLKPFRIQCDEKSLEYYERIPGTLEITIPRGLRTGSIKIQS